MSRITERSRSGALEAFLKGQKVLMLTEFDDDSLGIQRLEELLPEDARYLVDAVPAVENPEFKQAVEEMVEQKTEELTEESIAPPDTSEEPEMKPKRKSTPLPESEHEDRRTIIGDLVEQGMGIGICVCPASTGVHGQKSMDVTMQGLWSTAEDAQ